MSSSDYIAHLDGFTVISGGWLNQNWIQLGYQLADSVTGGVYSFGGTCIILGCLDGIGKFLPIFKPEPPKRRKFSVSTMSRSASSL